MDPRTRLRLPLAPVLGIAGLSAATNLLLLTGPFFLRQIYDLVFPSRSVDLLVELFILVAALYAALTMLDALRCRIGTRIGSRIQSDYDLTVFRSEIGPEKDAPCHAGSADVAAVRRFWGSPLALSLFDLPFTPFFLAGIFFLHPLLGGVALGGSALLVALATWNRSYRLLLKADANAAARSAMALGNEIRRAEDSVRALGMTDALAARWRRHRAEQQLAEATLSDRNALFGASSRGFRLFLQSALLAVGAWLVLRGDLSSGVILAMTVMLGRALAPVEAIIAGWDTLASARGAWVALARFAPTVATAASSVASTRPAPTVELSAVSAGAPGGPDTLHCISFRVDAGQALAIVGPSGAGKSSIAQVLTGIWSAREGSIRLSGRDIAGQPPEALAQQIGYLPQEVVLFEGTVAENIARFRPDADAGRILAAAVAAGIEEMILRLPAGYETQVGRGGRALSGGQRQRIGLARALFSDPKVLVFDEPDASLDAEAALAVTRAIHGAKARGCAVIVITHRPGPLAACDLVLHLRDGVVPEQRYHWMACLSPRVQSVTCAQAPEPARPRPVRHAQVAYCRKNPA